MTTTMPPPLTPSQGVPPPHDPAPLAGDLDARIRQVELRLIAREEKLKTEVRRLVQRGRRALRPMNLMMAAAGAVGGASVGFWAMRRLRKSRTAATSSSAGASQGTAAGVAASRADLPWVPWLGLAWPMLPAAWRARVSPGMAAGLASVGLPLLQQLTKQLKSAPQALLPTVEHVDLSRYAGTWYEIARLRAPFEAPCSGQPSATYTLRNVGLSVVNRRPQPGGSDAVVRGVARVVPGSGNARLRVSLWPTWLQWLPFAWCDYQVLCVDPRYETALVGAPDRRFLRLLSRTRSLSEARRAELVEMAAQRGFDVHRLHFNAP